jgi:glycosyltransferase involved in cell wall biosynthesis
LIKKNILFISSWFPNKIEATNGNFVQRHAEAVSQLHDVEILHAIGDRNQKEKFLFDDKIINGIRTLIVYYKNSEISAINFLRRMKAYRLGFKKMKMPDLVHANVLHNSMFFAVWLKKKHKIPFVVTEHWSIFLKINRKKLSKIKLFTARQIAKYASYLFPVSENLKENMQHLDIRGNYKVVGNVVDTDLFVVNEKEKEKFIFLHVSCLVALKNPDKIIATAKKLYEEFQNFELHIGGDGDVKALEKQIREIKAENYIKTFGEIPLNMVAEKMQNSSCFVLFSDYENLPCVLLESMSSGVPVIATNVGGIPEIVKNGHGIIIEKSEKELYDAMKNVITKNTNFLSPQDLHDYVDINFSKKSIAKQFDEIYRKI